MSDVADELRIIATETGRLSLADRAKLAECADVLERALHDAEKASSDLVAEAGRRVALAEALREANRKLQSRGDIADEPPWSMSTGWLKCGVLS